MSPFTREGTRFRGEKPTQRGRTFRQRSRSDRWHQATSLYDPEAFHCRDQEPGKGTSQLDEIWSLCYSKQKNVPADLRGVFGFGDVWTWTAICADTKIVPS